MVLGDEGPRGLRKPSTRNRAAPKKLQGAVSSEDELSLPTFAPQDGPPVPDSDESDTSDSRSHSRKARQVKVVVAGPKQPWKYKQIVESKNIKEVLQEITRSDGLWYKVRFDDGREKEISTHDIMNFKNGEKALWAFNRTEDSDDEEIREANSLDPPTAQKQQKITLSLRATASGPSTKRNWNPKASGLEESEEEADDSTAKRQRITRTRMATIGSRKGSAAVSEDDSSSSEIFRGPSKALRLGRGGKAFQSGVMTTRRSARTSSGKGIEYAEISVWKADEEDSVADRSAVIPSSDDDILYDTRRQRSRRSTRAVPPSRGRGRGKVVQRRGHSRNASTSDEEAPVPTRVSGRANKAKVSMKEHLEDEEMYAEDVTGDNDPKVISVREVFRSLPTKSAFRIVHNNQCDVCSGEGTASNKGPSPLIYCQGCSTSIHKACLGIRSQREHMVTKIGDEDFVMQCRRCVGIAAKKDATAPSLDICQICKSPGLACAPFSQKKTSKQEQKLREENNGKDPITIVDDELVNNASTVLFRCISCRRGCHFHHLPPRDSKQEAPEADAEARLDEYSVDWQCIECTENTAKVQRLVAWRPANVEEYKPGRPYDEIGEDEKEYLIKWFFRSYFRCTWMPGAWVWGVTSAHSRNAFAKRGDGLPKMTEAEAIPEEFLRMEIIMDVKYSSRVTTRTEEIDKARVNEVSEVYVKFQGLGYDEIVWEYPPDVSETERWTDFVSAYNEYVAGKYFKQPLAKMKERLQAYRDLDFEKHHLMADQPSALTGGKMMEYQLEGMNWLLFNFHHEKNVILADEMGLGKTIQVIAALATLVKTNPKCWPFLVVVPNSTCPNWRREIKQWAPSLRVVAFYGVKEARDKAMKYELFPDGCSDIRAHIVVTSFEAPVEEHRFFKRIKWSGLIVDEGQRLKNDKNLLYGALTSLNVSFRVLLTGTPLQNNKRELFNLLQFIDDGMDAERLDEEYLELTEENLPRLHALIRPYFLRRTKVQVLKFLPPMAQVIVPVTMSVLQKKVYKSILSKSPDLIKAIMTKNQAQIHPKDRGSLNNMLMQLRKVLCHPFIYSDAIEERKDESVLHRNLVDASSKLQLLEIMLPKLQERGHRVLIFSQFLNQLDIIEDFLVGLGLAFQRLDGNVGTLEKQKRIDMFNAPNSPLFAFLLSTRAGGVGINLATADTVIIMDPDFNPHQDIQALSRAHRIGQKSKVLVFQFMTKDSAEEKIVQIGRKKMALDHALIEKMDADEDAGVDLQSILKYGAEALFNDNDQNDIRYDSASVDKLLDRSQMENTNAEEDKTAESQFSFARIWANEKGNLVDDIEDNDSDGAAPDPSVWLRILEEREAADARERAAKDERFGRGRRARQNVDYRGSHLGADDEFIGMTPRDKNKSGRQADDDSSDFADGPEEPDVESDPDTNGVDPRELEDTQPRSKLSEQLQVQDRPVNTFHRVKVPKRAPYSLGAGDDHNGAGAINNDVNKPQYCQACRSLHRVGYCPLKLAGVEYCGLCGLAHFGGSNSCPHLQSEGRVRRMLEALLTSTEPQEYKDQAKQYLRGLIAEIVRRKSQNQNSGRPIGSQPLSQPSVPSNLVPAAHLLDHAGTLPMNYQPPTSWQPPP